MSDEQHVSPGEADYRLLALVMSLATAAWSQLGKIAHPVTQKVERDLEQAKVTIDFLQMLLEKTKGNLKPKEDEMLRGVVADLQMNFADEASRPDEKSTKGPDLIIPSGAKGPEIIKP